MSLSSSLSRSPALLPLPLFLHRSPSPASGDSALGPPLGPCLRREARYFDEGFRKVRTKIYLCAKSAARPSSPAATEAKGPAAASAAASSSQGDPTAGADLAAAIAKRWTRISRKSSPGKQAPGTW
jgi:hypothetical protein